ncbi:MAG: ParB/RepB/Spo0J family partition protein [Clostridia bacterium]|nr:ParB/RepB/Spo0J family partition protein [Clostridia bacterium]
MATKNRGLGRGLDAIFAENTVETGGAVTLRLSEIEPNRNQPRKEFDEAALSELADSISEHGLLQPILVRPMPDGGYRIVAGERRWRACRMAGLSEIPAVIRELSELESAQIALVENLQREDLNPLEEAEGYGVLIETYGMTQEEAAKTVGKSRPAVANALRLLSLPESVKTLLREGKLSAGHARALLTIEDPLQIEKAALLITEKGLSVRAAERLAREKKRRKKPENPHRNILFSEAELALREQLGRKVSINGTRKKGTLQIEFYGEEDLKELLKSFR